jgi:hypothetical protein
MGFLTLCVAFVLLWVRSYWWHDAVYRNSRHGSWIVGSFLGQVEYMMSHRETSGVDLPIRLSRRTAEDYRRILAAAMQIPGVMSPTLKFQAWGFEWFDPAVWFKFKVPYWFLVLATVVAGIALKPKPRFRFSLFDCLAATTFAALLAGLVAWLVRLQG